MREKKGKFEIVIFFFHRQSERRIDGETTDGEIQNFKWRRLPTLSASTGFPARSRTMVLRP
jgi:hypothetical protein